MTLAVDWDVKPQHKENQYILYNGAIYMYKIMKKKCIKSDFKEIFWNLQQMTKVTRCSCWHKNFVPKGLPAPTLGLYTCIKLWKKMYKIRLQRVFETCSNWPKRQGASVDIKILSPGVVPDLWLYTFIESWKDVYKVRGWRESYLFKLATNDHSD